MFLFLCFSLPSPGSKKKKKGKLIKVKDKELAKSSGSLLQNAPQIIYGREGKHAF